VSVKGRMIGRQPAWLIRREGHVEMTRLRSIPLCAKKPAKKNLLLRKYTSGGSTVAGGSLYKLDPVPPYPADSTVFPALSFQKLITVDAPNRYSFAINMANFRPSFLGSFHEFLQSYPRSPQLAGFSCAGRTFAKVW